MPDYSPLDPAEMAAVASPPKETWTPILPVPPDAPSALPPHRLGKPSARWPYRDAEGRLLGHVCRFDLPDGGKEILPLTFCQNAATGKTAWRWLGFPSPRPLYGLEKLAARPDTPVLVCEGEKAADAAQALFPGHVAVTSPSGSNAAGTADWTPLKGRRVVVWPDADQPGRKYAAAAARLASAAGASVRVVAVPTDWRVGWDVADDLPEGVTGDDLHRMLAEAKAAEPIGTNGTIGTGSGWPAPDMSVVADGRRPPPTLPIAAFGPWAQWITDTAEGVSAPADYVAAGLLSLASALIGNACWVSPWPSWREPPVLWLALVGDPSAAKSPALSPIMGLARRIETAIGAGYDGMVRDHATAKEAAACTRSAWEKRVAAAVKDASPPPAMPAEAQEPAPPSRPRVAVSDTTVEALGIILAGQPKGILMARDELAGWLASFGRYSGGSGGGGSDRAFWLEANGGRSYTVDRVKNPVPIAIPRLSVAVVGGIQPDRLSSLLMTGDSDGLAARLLMTWPDPVPPRRPSRHANNEGAFAALMRLQGLPLVSGQDGDEPVVVPLTGAAATLFDDWRKENYTESFGTSGRLAEHRAKLPGMVLRLSLVLELLWWSWTGDGNPPTAVSYPAVAAAAMLVSDHFVPMAERAYGDAALPEAERLGATLGRWIIKTRPARINARNVRRKAGLPGLRDAEAVKAAIGCLVDADWLQPAPSRDGDNQGRQRSDYECNPRIWEASNVALG